jgi:hypothetical protein
MRTPANDSLIRPIYRERVVPGPGAFIPLVLVPPTGYLTLTPINDTLGIVVGVLGAVLTAALMIWLAPVIELSQDTLKIGKANVPRSALGKAVSIPAAEAFAERGPKLNAMAFVKFQPTVKTLIKVEVIDPTDPTPYLLFSTRRPELLASQINSSS